MAAQGPSVPRLDVRCVGSSTLVGHGLHAQPCSSVAVLENDHPMLLIGCGPGVVRSCISRVGSLPRNIFLPSTKLISMSDLQVAIQHEAVHQRKLKVYAPADVLDKAVALLDEDIIPDVRDYVEFLQVEPGIATSVTPQYCLVCQKVNPFAEVATPQANGVSPASCTAFNFVLMDITQRPLLSYLEGPLVVNKDVESFRAAPCSVVHLWKGFRLDALRANFHGNSATGGGGFDPRIVAIGYSSEEPPREIHPPALALRPGDTFSLPLVRVAGHSGAETTDLAWLNRGGEPVNPTSAFTTQPQPQPQHGGFAPQPRTHNAPPPQQHPGTYQQPTMTSSSRHQDGTYRELEYGPPRTGNTPRGRTPPATSRQHQQYESHQQQASYQGTSSAGYGGAVRSNSGRSMTPNGNRSFKSGRMPGIQKYEPQGALFSHQATAPRKLYVFSNETLDAEPVIVMLQPHMKLTALKSKISQLLNLRPMGHLHTIDDGLVRSADQLEHCQEVVATKHAGAPFDPDHSRLPVYMKATRRAAPMEDVLPMVDLH